jgi:hypothetical protein
LGNRNEPKNRSRAATTGEYARGVSRHYGVEGIVLTALDAIDKPDAFRSSPEHALTRMLEQYGSDAFADALERIRELLTLNSHDVVALGAERLLENVLAG